MLIPLLVVMFLGIRYHYQRVERELTASLPLHQKDIQHRLIVPVVSLNLAAEYSLVYARSISPHVVAIHIATKNETGALRTAWEDWQKHLSEDERPELVVIKPSRCSPLRALLTSINALQQQHPDGYIDGDPARVCRVFFIRALTPQPKGASIEDSTLLPARNCGDKRCIVAT